MSSLKVHVSSPDTFSERTYDANLTIGHLKQKLESVTGISPGSQILVLCQSESDETVIKQLDDESASLASYGVQDWNLIKVSDKNPATSLAGQFTDVSQVEKFELSKEDYEQRRDTVLQYKKQHKMGRFAPSAEQGSEVPAQASSHHIVIGSRCEVSLTGEDGFKRRGTVRFVGPTKFGKGGGEWVGVEYDEPVGKNDGSVDGERYFTCAPKHGGFVRADKMKIGDYPEEVIDVEEM